MKPHAYSESIMRFAGNRTLLHIVFWLCLFSPMVLLETGDMPFSTRLLHSSVYLGFIAAATYIHFYLLGRRLNRRRYPVYFGALILTLGVLGILLNSVSSDLFKSGGNLPGTIFSLLFFLGFTTAIRYARAGIRQRMQLQEITAKQLQTELALLKAQINPHFLFNTLNNLYALALRQEDSSTAHGIAKLSHLMRYVIYESNVDRIELAGAFRDPFHALEHLAANPADLLFLDVNMPDMNGIQFLNSIHTRPLVIFTTAYSEYAVRSYDYDAVDYLLKPIEFERFMRAVHKALEQHLQGKKAARFPHPNGSTLRGGAGQLPGGQERHRLPQTSDR